MTTDVQILAELESLGTEQNRKVYRRHGAGEKTYGVSYADLRKLIKRILEQKALAAARRIGKVVVDHGHTNCKIPDAVEYIERARQRKKR